MISSVLYGRALLATTAQVSDPDLGVGWGCDYEYEIATMQTPIAGLERDYLGEKGDREERVMEEELVGLRRVSFFFFFSVFSVFFDPPPPPAFRSILSLLYYSYNPDYRLLIYPSYTPI